MHRPLPADRVDRARQALVVFTDQGQVSWLRWLRPGFRHCFVAKPTTDGWILCDWIKGRLVLEGVTGWPLPELARHYRKAGHTVLCVPLPRRARRRPGLRILSCVEVVKQVLGLDGLCPLTPFGLYRRLLRATSGADVVY